MLERQIDQERIRERDRDRGEKERNCLSTQQSFLGRALNSVKILPAKQWTADEFENQYLEGSLSSDGKFTTSEY